VPQHNLAKSAGKFVKHVLPAAVKPVHSLWHEVLGFIFLFIAGSAGVYLVRKSGGLTPIQIVPIVILIVVMVPYGISSFLKARRISRS
jgi:hypothetical protein